MKKEKKFTINKDIAYLVGLLIAVIVIALLVHVGRSSFNAGKESVICEKCPEIDYNYEIVKENGIKKFHASLDHKNLLFNYNEINGYFRLENKNKRTNKSVSVVFNENSNFVIVEIKEPDCSKYCTRIYSAKIITEEVQ